MLLAGYDFASSANYNPINIFIESALNTLFLVI